MEALYCGYKFPTICLFPTIIMSLSVSNHCSISTISLYFEPSLSLFQPSLHISNHVAIFPTKSLFPTIVLLKPSFYFNHLSIFQPCLYISNHTCLSLLPTIVLLKPSIISHLHFFLSLGHWGWNHTSLDKPQSHNHRTLQPRHYGFGRFLTIKTPTCVFPGIGKKRKKFIQSGARTHQC